MNKKHIKVLFILVFIFTLIGPNILFYLPNLNLQNTENRVLLEKPKLNLMNIGQFTQEFDAYYSDNLPFKNKLVEFNSFIKMNIFNQSPQKYVVKGKNDWLFYNSKFKDDGDTLADYQGINHYTIEQLEEFKNKILKMQEVCDRNGSDFYLMVAPNKSQIYDEYLPNGYKKINNKSKVDLLIDYLKENTNIKIIYPKDELLKYRDKYQLYYKLDTHWNPLGAYVGYSQIAKSIGNDYTDITKVKVENRETLGGDLANMIGLNSKLKEREYFVNDNRYNYDLVEQNQNILARYKSDNKNGKKIVCFRDSFFVSVIPHLAQDYEESLFLWQRNFDENIIKNEKPDVVIMESVERYIDLVN